MNEDKIPNAIIALGISDCQGTARRRRLVQLQIIKRIIEQGALKWTSLRSKRHFAFGCFAAAKDKIGIKWLCLYNKDALSEEYEPVPVFRIRQTRKTCGIPLFDTGYALQSRKKGDSILSKI